ncbi:MAG: sulfatase [Planctomycetota bacterium]
MKQTRGLINCCVFLVVVLISILAVKASVVAADQGQKPNFVFILIDDLGWADVGCYGNKFNETPNIDRLAAQGMLFTDAYAACCVCSPTRASIETGKYPATLNITDWIPGHQRPWAKLNIPQIDLHLPLKEVTIAEALKPAGYVTGYFGKWHLGRDQYYPGAQGYDDWMVLTRHRHFYPRFQCKPPQQLKKGDYLADLLTDKTVKFIEAHKNKPFMVTISHFAVHIPLQAKADKEDKYKAKPKPDQGINHPIYAAMLESVDDGVGRIMDKLEELKLAQRTVVIFYSDNGGLRQMYNGKGPIVTSNAPLRDEKGSPYEGGTRVPLIVRWPEEVEPGSKCNVPVTSVDIYPTLLEMAGTPGDPQHKHEGESIVPLLKQTGKLKRQAIYWHYPHYHHSTPSSSIRHGNYKLIEFFEDNRLELYNLRKDIGEKNNLAAKMPELAKQLRDKLDRWRKSVNAGIPTPNPNHDPARAHEWGKR